MTKNTLKRMMAFILLALLLLPNVSYAFEDEMPLSTPTSIWATETKSYGMTTPVPTSVFVRRIVYHAVYEGYIGRVTYYYDPGQDKNIASFAGTIYRNGVVPN